MIHMQMNRMHDLGGWCSQLFDTFFGHDGVWELETYQMICLMRLEKSTPAGFVNKMLSCTK